MKVNTAGKLKQKQEDDDDVYAYSSMIASGEGGKDLKKES
jgi:hypothetical protein